MHSEFLLSLAFQFFKTNFGAKQLSVRPILGELWNHAVPFPPQTSQYQTNHNLSYPATPPLPVMTPV